MDHDPALLSLVQTLASGPPDNEGLRARLQEADVLHPERLANLRRVVGHAIATDLIASKPGALLLAGIDALAMAAPTLHCSFSDTVSGPGSTLLRTVSASAAESAAATTIRTHVIPERRVATLGGTEPARFNPGEMVKGRFLLKEKIGEGGMGVVFCALDKRKTEARDPNPLIAIKVLNAEVARHATAFIALQREARKAQSLAHPNVATVFDFDRDGDTPFICMELLRGRSLDQLLHGFGESGIGREQCLRIIRDVAEGLANAHRNGIVHSDLKPGNVFVTDEGTTKILDFGIARAMPQASAEGPPGDLFDARPLFFAYTEAYATAEMVKGSDPHPADDIYALSLIVYQLFAGTHPYQRYSAPKAREMGLKVAAPQGLRRHEWRAVKRGLSFDRRERPQDATEFLAQFFPRRPQRILISTAVVLGLVAAFSGYRNYQSSGPVIAFERLPAPAQQQFLSFMKDGDRLWQFYQQDGNFLALQEAAEEYTEAYALHPGNRQAVHALEKVADAALRDTEASPLQQREIARALAQRSDFLAKYPPIVAASE